MRRWMGMVLGIVLVLGVAGCDWGDRITALETTTTALETTSGHLTAWANLMTVDDDPTTDPGSAQDPAYALVQSRAICKLLSQVEVLHRLNPADRSDELKALCGGAPTDPVYPPRFPPPEE